MTGLSPSSRGTAWERNESGFRKTPIHVLVPSLHGLAVWGSQRVIGDGDAHTAWSDTGDIYTEHWQKSSKSLSLLVLTSGRTLRMPFLGRVGILEMRQGLQQRLGTPLRLTRFPTWGGVMLYPSCPHAPPPRQAGSPTPGAGLPYPTRKPAGTFPASLSWGAGARGPAMQSWVVGGGAHSMTLRWPTQGKSCLPKVAGPLAGGGSD